MLKSFPPAQPRLSIGGVIALLLFATGARAQIDFDRDIRPILSDNCYFCHGPDAKARKAGLRLDQKEGAFRLRRGKSVLVPGKSTQSELIRRITATDPGEIMPPPESNRKLTPQQIARIKRWVDEGAQWSRHWALVPPQRPKLPAIKRKDWPREALDNFVLARLDKEALQPAPEARRETWQRRVTLDLTGLPPTPPEIDAFLADSAPEAYEKVVDRLLASPAYGERMAADWLDVARFADTHGYQMDRYRPVWPYRDWVISAFNRNLPFDQFITWQLAGDLLPGATKEQRLATAFNRLHMQNEEGGIVEEEFRVAYVVDRVNTMGTAFLGLTFECSRCHDHKFDPISQRDFYSLFAFFQNIDESGQTSYFTSSMPVPTLLLSDDATDARLAKLRRQIAVKESELEHLREAAEKPLPVSADLQTGANAAFESWLRSKPENPTLPGLVGAFSFESLDGGRIINNADAAKPGQAVEDPKLVAGKIGKAAQLNGENGFSFPGLGHFSRSQPFSLSLWLQTESWAPRNVVVHHSMAPIDAGSRGYELLLENGHVAFAMHHMWPRNSLKVVTRWRLPTATWKHVTVTYDGSSRASGVHIYIDGLRAGIEVVRDGLFKDITYGGTEPNLAIGYRFRDAGFKEGKVDEFRIFSREVTPLEAAVLAGRNEVTAFWKQRPDRLRPVQRDLLLTYFLATTYPPALQRQAQLQALRTQESRTVNPIAEIMVMEEMSAPKPAFILKRGAYDAPGERVSANTPAALPSFPADQPHNRLGLARWLTARDHPLTARVTVNRVWQMMFGKGIVETSDNFGSQGAPPTHPELLDWLARDFVDTGWNVKHLIRNIALSATYRQSSQARPALMARDPGNQLLARGPARRLTAEMLRDQALAVSGLLIQRLGGPSVKSYQPEGLWEVAMGSPHYDQGKGADLHRRSLYTFWKRTVPHPALVLNDAADRSVCTVRRQSTSTPLQALQLLNDTQILEAARFAGQRMLDEGGATNAERVAWLFRLVTSRRPSARETDVLLRLFEEQRALYATDSQAAAKLLAVGETRNNPALSSCDLAAGTVLALAILNHDVAVIRR